MESITISDFGTDSATDLSVYVSRLILILTATRTVKVAMTVIMKN